jgi:transposase
MYVRKLRPEEQAELEAGLRSSEAFTLRRSQILLASSRGHRPKVIAHNLGCATQTVRNAIHAFEEKGVACLAHESSRPQTVQAPFDQAKCDALRAILHKPPHVYGRMTSLWTLALAAEVCFEQGFTANLVSIETIRQALLRLGWGGSERSTGSPAPTLTISGKKTAGCPHCSRTAPRLGDRLYG